MRNPIYSVLSCAVRSLAVQAADSGYLQCGKKSYSAAAMQRMRSLKSCFQVEQLWRRSFWALEIRISKEAELHRQQPKSIPVHEEANSKDIVVIKPSELVCTLHIVQAIYN